MVNKGDLVKGINLGYLYQVTRGMYTARFTDPSADEDMYDCGMGHLAGTYETVIDVITLSGPSTGKEYRKQKISNFSRLTNETR